MLTIGRSVYYSKENILEWPLRCDLSWNLKNKEPTKGAWTEGPAGTKAEVDRNLGCLCVCAQLHPIICDPMDCGPPGSSVYGIFQTRILVWVAISYSRGSSRLRDGTRISCVSCLAGCFFTTVHLESLLSHATLSFFIGFYLLMLCEEFSLPCV